MSKDLHGELADEASAWAAENGGSPAAADTSGPGAAARPSQQTEAQPAAQPVSSSSSDRKTDDQVDDDDEQLDEELDLGTEDVAELAVALLDIGMTNFVGEHMALKPEQEKRLVRLSTKVAKKWLPEMEGAIEPEWALAAGLAMTYAPKFMSGPGKKPTSPASGGEPKPGGPAPSGPTTTATVDGRQVTAEVMP